MTQFLMTIDMARYQDLMAYDEEFKQWVVDNQPALGRVHQIWPIDHSLTMWRAVGLFDEDGNPYGDDPLMPSPLGIIVSTSPGKHKWLVARQSSDA